MLGSVGLGLGSVGTAAGQDAGAKEPATDDILSTIYANGLAAPDVDNLFAMPSGNLRFWGETGSGQLPGVAFFESTTSPADSRVPFWYTQRYYRTSVGIGGIAGDALVGYDPAWDGSLGSLNDLSVNDQVWLFSKNPAQDGYPSVGPQAVELGRTRVITFGGFFDGPDTWPVPGFNSGARPEWQMLLTNSVDGTPGVRASIDGWGTTYQFPRPNSNGIMAALDSRAGFGTGYSPAAGDGIGWFVRNSTQDPPKGIIDCFTLDGVVNTGPFGWRFWSYSGGSLGKLLQLDPIAGATFNVPLVFDAGLVAPGATAVTISNSPGASAAPAEYLQVTTPSGTRWIALLA